MAERDSAVGSDHDYDRADGARFSAFFVVSPLITFVDVLYGVLALAALLALIAAVED